MGEGYRYLRMVIKLGMDLLIQSPVTAYSQLDILHRMEKIDPKLEIHSSTISKAYKHGQGSLKLLKKISITILLIVEEDLKMQFDEKLGQFVALKGALNVESILNLPKPIHVNSPKGNIHSKGRLSLSQKVSFLQDAQKEVIFFGVRLKQFVNYFLGQKFEEFRGPIIHLLQRGVAVKAYLLDPEWTSTSIYFNDRSLALSIDHRSKNELYNSIEYLRLLKKEIDDIAPNAIFDSFTYAHFPSGYFLAVDGSTNVGKLHYAPYLYGIPRSESPVLEVHKKYEPILYSKLWDSLQHITLNAKAI